MKSTEIYTHFLNSLKTIYPKTEAENIVEWVFEHVSGKKRWQRRLDEQNGSDQLPAEQIRTLNSFLEQLLLHKPVQYVLHEAWFYKRRFYVDDSVLIPRPETEELVELVINYVKNNVTPHRCRVLDIGTGSGCIPISLKAELPACAVSAIDISEAALKVAARNARDLGVEVSFSQVDFLDELSWPALGQYDIIVSNPPYIPQSEKEMLDKNVTEFEPGTALFVENDDPFIFYKKILTFSKSHLSTAGAIFMEVHENFADDVRDLFTEEGLPCEVIRDIYGKNRMLKVIVT